MNYDDEWIQLYKQSELLGSLQELLICNDIRHKKLSNAKSIVTF
jgi:hypothetical protein